MSRKELAAELKAYVPVKFEDGHGFALKDFTQGLKRFGRSEYVVCMPTNTNRENDKPYKDSLMILDFLWSSEIIIPKINGTYVWGRKLKLTEDTEHVPQRIVNGMVAFRRDVPTPRIIAFTEGDGKRMFTEFHGAENLMSALNYGIDNFDVTIQKEASVDARAFWNEEERLRQKHEKLPYLSDLCEHDKSDEIAWHRKLEKKYQHGQIVPYWIDSMAYMAETRKMNEKTREKWKQEIINYGKLHEGYNNAILLMHKNGKHPSEKIEDICRSIGRRLRDCSETGVLLLDVAPRDVIIDADLKPWFADMENVEFYKRPLSKYVQKRQMDAVRDEFIQPSRKHYPHTKRDLLRIIEKAYYD